MKFNLFFSVVSVLLVLPNVSYALICGNTTCAPAGTWTHVSDGYDVKSAGECTDVDGIDFCAATSIRCAAGYFASDINDQCVPSGTATPGYYSKYGCFTLKCDSCIDTLGGVPGLTSIAGEAQNECQCFYQTEMMLLGENGYYEVTDPCYYRGVCNKNVPAVETPTSGQLPSGQLPSGGDAS